MKATKSNHIRLGIIVVALFIFPVVLKILYDCHPIVSLRHRILRGSDQYYIELADACAKIWQDHPLGTNDSLHFYRRELKDIPSIFEELTVLHIIIKTNEVDLMWGGFVDFSMQWRRVSDYEWQLDYVDDENGLPKTLYHRRTDKMTNDPNQPTSQGSEVDR